MADHNPFTITIPNDYFARSAAREYADDAGLALIREFAQNSCDAKAKTVEFTFRAGNELVVSDDGKGADATTIRERVLTPLESFKDAGAVGGFGKAKELLFFANQSWKIRTRDVEVRGSYLDVTSFQTGLDHAPGFLAVVTLPEGLYKSAQVNVRRFLESSERPGVSWILNGDQVKTVVTRAKRCIKDFGFAKAYVERDCADTNIYVRTGGLLTAKRYGYQPHQVGRVVLEVTAASVDVLTPARDWFRLAEHRHAVESWLNELVVNYERTLADELGDELLFVDEEFVAPEVPKSGLVGGEVIPQTGGIVAEVSFLSSEAAKPTIEQLAEALSEFKDVLLPTDPATGEVVTTTSKADEPAEKPKSEKGFDLSLMPKVEGLKRITVHTGGKVQAKKAVSWLKKNKKEAAALLTAWTTAVRVAAKANDLPVDAVGFTFSEAAEAEFVKASNGRFALLVNPTKVQAADYHLPDDLMDFAIHELAHQLRGRSHDELWARFEADVRKGCRKAAVRGAIARSLITGSIEEAV